MLLKKSPSIGQYCFTFNGIWRDKLYHAAGRPCHPPQFCGASHLREGITKFLKWHAVGRNQKPFVISVSSEGDWATKDVFPLGTIPASAFDVGSYQGKTSYQGANEKTFFTHTPGHTPYLASFDAYPIGRIPKDQFSSDYQYEWIFYRNLHPTDFG